MTLHGLSFLQSSVFGVCASLDADFASRAHEINDFSVVRDDGHCDLPRVDGRGMDWQTFDRKLRGQPLVLTNLGPRMLWSRAGFLKAFGPLYAQLNNGRFDDSRSQEVMTVEEYLTSNRSSMHFFKAEPNDVFHSSVLAEVKHTSPSLFKDFHARPILSVGTAGSSTNFHKHDETWMLLLAGRKGWWLTPKGEPLPNATDPCAFLPAALQRAVVDVVNMNRKGPYSSRRKMHLCVQHPGEIIYFPNQMQHATCNLDEFVFGFGAQGHISRWPTLHKTAYRNDTDQLKLLVRASNVSVDETDFEGYTAFHRATTFGHLAAVDILVRAKAALDVLDGEGRSSLGTATRAGDLQLVRYLANARAKIGSRERTGLQAVHWAAMAAHIKVMRFLLAERASLQAKGPGGSLPIHMAAAQSNSVMMAFLLNGTTARLDARAETASQPLHFAATAGHDAIVGFLIDSRSRTDAKGGEGRTAIHMASVSGHATVVHRLLANRANTEIPSAAGDGDRPIHSAAGAGHTDIIDLLLASHANAAAPDAALKQPLHHAAENGHVAAVRLLLEQDRVKGDARDSQGNAAAHFAAVSGHIPTLKELAKARANLQILNFDGDPPSIAAAAFGHGAAAGFLQHWPRSARRSRKRKKVGEL